MLIFFIIIFALESKRKIPSAAPSWLLLIFNDSIRRRVINLSQLFLLF